jgi:hypothetical protein
MNFGSYPGRVIRRFEDPATAPLCEGYNCDCEKPSVVEIQGETDSFGYESLFFCHECWQKMLKGEEDYEEEILSEEHDISQETDEPVTNAYIGNAAVTHYAYINEPK